MTYRFEFSAPDTDNIQTITFTVLNAGVSVETATGTTTPISASSPTTNSVTVNGVAYKLFAGLREDTFSFDVQRFFEVRAFLASTFFGGVAATTPLAAFQAKDNCNGKSFLEGFSGGYDTTGAGATSASASNGDIVHLFNPPSCAEDFTKGYNRNDIALQTTIASLQSSAETTFDTWSTISIPQ